MLFFFVALSAIVLHHSVGGTPEAVSPEILDALTKEGSDILQKEIVASKDRLEIAKAALDVIFRTCEDNAKQHEQECLACVNGKCQERAAVCRSPDYPPVTMIDEIGIPTSALTNPRIVETLTTIGAGLAAANLVVDQGKKLLNSGKKIIKKVFGRRRDVSKQQDMQEPECGQFARSEKNVCGFFAKRCPGKCPLDFEKDCPGYADVQKRYIQVAGREKWAAMHPATPNFSVESVLTENKITFVTAAVFDKRTSFYLARQISLSDLAAKIAETALSWYKTQQF